GTMPQTRFVLKKALEQKLKPFVDLNKEDRPNARPEEVVDEGLDLFIELGADDDQLEYLVLYASAINVTTGTEQKDQQETMDPIVEGIMRDIPNPKDNSDEPLQMQMTLLEYNDYVGRIGIGRVSRGKIHVGQQVVLLKKDGTEKKFRVTKLFGFIGLK